MRQETRDPEYGRAHAGIAVALATLPFSEDTNTDSIASLARTAAERAIALDSTLSDAWAAKGHVNAYQWRNAAAARDYDRAIQLDSTSATARCWRGLYLSHAGRFAEAAAELQRARTLEPTVSVIRAGGAYPDLAQGRLAAAESTMRGIFAVDSSFTPLYAGIAHVLTLRGKYEEAIQLAAIAASTPGYNQAETKGVYAFALARVGRAAEARAARPCSNLPSGRSR